MKSTQWERGKAISSMHVICSTVVSERRMSSTEQNFRSALSLISKEDRNPKRNSLFCFKYLIMFFWSFWIFKYPPESFCLLLMWTLCFSWNLFAWVPSVGEAFFDLCNPVKCDHTPTWHNEIFEPKIVQSLRCKTCNSQLRDVTRASHHMCLTSFLR